MLSMVAELHRRGYEQLRIVSGLSPSGMHGRCTVTPAALLDRDPGDSLVAFYTTGQERAYFGWPDAAAASAEALADKFLARFPALGAQAHNPIPPPPPGIRKCCVSRLPQACRSRMPIGR